jgi:competence ComEA-like helix-hairpin-helix protein
MSSHASSLRNIRAVFAFMLLISEILLIPSCVTRSRTHPTATEAKVNDEPTLSSSRTTGSTQPNTPRINVNTASAGELETLPGIGRALAERIIEHREKFGPFRRPEHLIIVRGISDKRFRALRDLVTVE